MSSSLSDFLMYGGQRNPYMADLKEMEHKKSEKEPLKNEEAAKITRIEIEATTNILQGASKDSSVRVALRPNKAAPRLLPVRNQAFQDGYDLGDQEPPEESISLVVSSGSRLGMKTYDDSLADEPESAYKMEDQRVHGDAFDFII